MALGEVRLTHMTLTHTFIGSNPIAPAISGVIATCGAPLKKS